MTSRHLKSPSPPLALLALFLLALRVAAMDLTKSADDFFHGGAMHYLSNNIPAALDVVTNGLQQFPNDAKLKQLEALLKQQQNQKQDQKQDQQKSDQQNQQDQKKDPSQQSKQDDKQQKQDQQQSEQKKEEQKSDQQKPQPKPGDEKDSGEQKQASGNPDRQEQMTPEQALRVLDTLKGDEKVLPLQPVDAKPPTRPVKDW